jgi:DNA replication protein DnaC
MALRFEQTDSIVIPTRFRDAQFDENTSEGIQAIGNEFLNNFEQYYRAGVGPAFFGIPGVGKTHAAAVVAKRLNEKKVPMILRICRKCRDRGNCFLSF